MRTAVIEIEGRFVDHITGETQSASKAVEGIGKSAQQAQKQVDQLSRKKAKPIFDADDSKLLKKLRAAEEKAERLGRTKTKMVLEVMDKATVVIGKVLNKAQAFAGKTWRGFINLKDSNAYATIKKITDGAHNLTKKTWSVLVKVKDLATSPLRLIKNSLFSIKGLIATIGTLWAGSKLFSAGIKNPLGLADAYSSTQIGFSTLLGASGGQKMMDDLDELARVTPFKTSGVISSAQKMMAYGWDADRIVKDMETIGDAAAATGKGTEGLESIVYAMSEIRSKGKLSTQELNQLAGAGIKAKAYLAEGLGYGTSDAGMKKLAEDLEKGAIGANQAIDLILEGMKEFNGMMDRTANETVEGLWSQIEDTFEINIFRKWGQGLQDGAKRGFGSVVKLLDEAQGALEQFGDLAYEVGSKLSNWVADKFENTIGRILEITDSYDFRNASFGKKISMLWKGVIVDPLKEWWEGGGQKKTAETAGKIGSWMGETLTKGLLAVLGVTDVFEDGKLGMEGGMSVAQSFVKGFKDNFDGSAITDAFVDAISDVWNALPTWAKWMIGGYTGGKAFMGLANVGSAIGTVVGGAKSLWGTAGGYAADGTMIAASGLRGYFGTPGNAMVAGTGLSSKLATLGYAVSGGAAGSTMSGGMAALLGGVGAAGGIAAGASAVKGGIDLYGSYKAYQRGDKNEGKAKAASGGSALGGVAAGAAIGSLFGPLGALVGAGVGGVAGWIGGEKWADNIRDAKYEVEGTAKAIKDAATEEEKLAALNEAAWENMKRHMGDIKLTAAEIERLSNQIVWGEDLGAYEKFSAAVQNAEANLQSLKSAAGDTEKWMWKASLGVKFNEDEVEAIKASFDEYINSAKSYVENKHYEFTAAVSMLVDVKSKEGKAIIESGNDFYGKMQEKLSKAGDELGKTLTKALKDGIISADEQEAITAAQQKIASITEKISSAEAKAELELIKVKFGKGNLDLDSFDNFMSQMETTLNQRISANDEAFTASVASLNLQLAEGAISEEEYNKQLQTLVNGYKGKVKSIKAEIMDVELDIIGDAYSDELGKDAAGKLQKALEKSLSEGINPIDWTPEQARKFLGIPDLKDDTAKAIATMLGGVANQLELVEVNGKLLLDLGIETEGDTGEKVKNEVDKSVPDKVEKTVGVDISGEKEIQNKIDVVADEFGIPEEHAATVAMLLYGDKELLNKIDVSQLAKEFGIPEEQAKKIIEKLTGVKSIENKVSVLADDFGIPDVVTKTVQIKVRGYVTAQGNPKMSRAAKEAILYNQTYGSEYRGGIVGGSSSMESFFRGGIAGYSDGGMVRGGSRLIEVAEEGSPEMIIPLSSQRRGRALKLWAQAGHMMDVPGFARGGLTSGADEGFRFQRYEGGETSGGQTVQVDIGGITFEINVSGDGNQSIAEAIKAQAAEIAETVAGIVADALGAQFENTPARGGAA